MYTGAIDVVKKTLARDGPAGYVPTETAVLEGLTVVCSLYRGVVPPLLGVTPTFAVSFWVGQPQISRVIIPTLISRSFTLESIFDSMGQLYC